MSDDRLDHADVDPDGDWTGALLRAHLAVVDPFLAEIAIDRGQRCGLAVPGWFPYLAHFGYMKVDEVANGLEAGDG
ncbi:hypothetical protein [uncultured Roseobacter sp.]|uniref:hypothetical protein n=1 Tax=uncultured Roseobacter sp. TaxID=114847 RepID=UPI0026093A98|nr:hypothetical protein [uncultured Roseobacter sp.]